MKRTLIIIAVLALAAVAWAGTSITVTPDSMKNGETKTLTDDGTKIKVTRNGGDVDIRIEGAGESRRITISRSGEGDIHISRNGRHTYTYQIPEMPEMPRIPPIRVPRMHEEHFDGLFVCPKDGTTLRVPKGKEGQTFKCPVDGTVMEKKKGHGFTMIIDGDDVIEDI
jgi:hypothetical protein